MEVKRRVKMIGWFRILEDLSVDVQIRLLRSCNVPRVRYALFCFHVRF